MPDVNLEGAGNIFLGVSVYVGMIIAAFWLAMVIWAFRDMRSRSRDTLAQILVALMVTVLTLPGLIIYIFLRPRETLSESYERSLEEEALLQEIEEKPTCPGCKQRVQEEWQACPSCHTRLKKPCVRCTRMLDLSWNLCPYCAIPQPVAASERPAGYSHVRPSSVPEQWSGSGSSRGEVLEFVDGED
jgi:hypothetical protein